MKNHLHSTFLIVHTLIPLKLSRINSKSSGRRCAFYIIMYITKKKNEFAIKPNIELEHRTKLRGIMERKIFIHTETFIYTIDNSFGQII